MKNALNYNDKLFKNKLENDNFLNENQIFSNNNKDQYSMISNKDLFDKIDQSLIDEVQKHKNSNYRTEDIKKPFKPFNFDK